MNRNRTSSGVHAGQALQPRARAKLEVKMAGNECKILML